MEEKMKARIKMAMIGLHKIEEENISINTDKMAITKAIFFERNR